MILDTLDNISRYKDIMPALYRGLEFLRDTDLSILPDGRYAIDGDRLFCNLQSYETKPANTVPESHRRYADIQYLVTGEELIGIAPLSDMESEAKAMPADDAWLWNGQTLPVLLKGSRFAVFFPEDAHAPGITPCGVPVHCRKAVVKVLLQQ